MVESDNEIEWRRHLLTALDNVSKKIDENSNEHIAIRDDVADVKMDVSALKAIEPDKRLTDYMQSSRGWRIVIVSQVVAILILIGSAIWNFSALTSTVTHIHENQKKVMQDIDDLKITSDGYRSFRMKAKAVEVAKGDY